MSMKVESEVAMKLLEKDVHEKQDTIVSLRDQLDEIKDINLDMYTKLQVNCRDFYSLCLFSMRPSVCNICVVRCDDVLF